MKLAYGQNEVIECCSLWTEIVNPKLFQPWCNCKDISGDLNYRVDNSKYIPTYFLSFSIT